MIAGDAYIIELKMSFKTLELNRIGELLAGQPILVIDDESRIRHLVSRYLAKIYFSGRNIVQASSAEEAIEKLKEQKFGLIILDLMLLDSSGFEVIKHLILDERETNQIAPPVVVISGNLHSGVMKNLIARGVQHILSKPFNFQNFVSKVQQALLS